MRKMKGELPESCDVAIIGAGMGGLTAGALLSKFGLSVCVVEREVRVGGYLAGFKRRKFTFDTAIHWLNQCGPGGLVRRVLDFLGDDAPSTAPLRRIRRYKGDSFDYLLTDEPDRLKQDFLRDFPADRPGIERFFADAKRVGHRMLLLGDRTRVPEVRSPLDRLGYGLQMTLWSRPLWRFLGTTAEKGLARYFPNSPALRAVFPSEERLLSILVPIGWAYWGDYQMPPIGGSQAFARFLNGRIEEQGSTVVTRVGVDQVRVENGRAVGLRLENGEQVRADYVIAAGDLLTLYERLLPAGTIPESKIRAIRNADLYPSSVTLSIGLDIDPRELGFGEELVFLSKDGVPRDAHNNTDPHTAGLSILAPSVRDPSLAPEGKGTLTIYASAEMAYGNRWATEGGLERGPDYRAFKERYADVLIDRVERAIAPGLREHIEVLDIATPVTHQRYTGNHDGSIMGQLASGPNIRNRVARYRTPVRRLYLGGHWAEFGGGVPLAVKAGANSSLLVLKEKGHPAYRTVCDLLDGRNPPGAAHALARRDAAPRGDATA
ncbi:MAG: NAD(P)/FAD-dependent oxidoreductase [Planctomycetes bacterium]|nr:NAD(P)/FAD-dependent oxidoreductase [Planctomycetota bacterium]